MEDTKYLPELLAEKDSLDSSFTHAMKLISAGKGEFGRSSACRSSRGLALPYGVRPVGYNVVVGDCWMNPEICYFARFKAARLIVQIRCQC